MPRIKQAVPGRRTVEAGARLLLLIPLLLAGCAEQEAKLPSCHVHQSSFGFGPGGAASLMSVANDQTWCSIAFQRSYGAGDVPFAEGMVLSSPQHGDVVVRKRAGRATFFYRPKPAFTGKDAFQVRLQGGDDHWVNVAVRASAAGLPAAVTQLAAPAVGADRPPELAAVGAGTSSMPNLPSRFTASERLAVERGCRARVGKSKIAAAASYCPCVVDGIETNMSLGELRLYFARALDGADEEDMAREFPVLRRIAAACIRRQAGG
jgi:hypothetical protein